jgi:FtsP/CotA-like multicopper oxidase with cupredoxin domain
MVAIALMANGILVSDRRQLLGALAAASLAPIFSGESRAGGPQQTSLEATAETFSLRPGQPETPVWSLQAEATGPSSVLRVRSGGQLDIALHNNLGVPVVPSWRGIDGAPSSEPLIAQMALAPGAKARLSVPLPRGGATCLCDLRLLADGEARPSRPLPVVVVEAATGTADRDEVVLVEDWRLRLNGTAMPPGIDAQDAAPSYTVNGRIQPDFAVRHNERLRLRLVNGCQRAVIALKIENHEVRVMALDGQPAEPFYARNGALVLAPGGRADCFIDAVGQPDSIAQIALHDGKEARPVARLVVSAEAPARPSPLPPATALPTNGLPAELDLKSALRVELVLNGSDWTRPASFSASTTPAFRTRAGRVVVLALINRADIATVFHLHGHHFRLLDRLDDGWKPFWLDTLAVEPGQIQRIAFLAEHAGRYLLESAATDWAAPKLVRWYAVE